MHHISDEELHAQHKKEVINARISGKQSHTDLGDIVLGAVDGTITTFAIVSGVAGTGLSGGAMIAFVLGLANVLADGFSMGISNYLKARSDMQMVDRYRKLEEMHIDRIPEGEKEEIRQIFAKKGFTDKTLEEIVAVITKDRKLWVDTMLREEWGLQTTPSKPHKAALFTFGAFLLAGIFPLLPLLLGLNQSISPQKIFLTSAAVTSIVFLFTGALRGKVLNQPVLKSAIETLLMGGAAAALAYIVGQLLSGLIA